MKCRHATYIHLGHENKAKNDSEYCTEMHGSENAAADTKTLIEEAMETKEGGKCEIKELKAPLGHASACTETDDNLRLAACNILGAIGPAGTDGKFVFSLCEEPNKTTCCLNFRVGVVFVLYCIVINSEVGTLACASSGFSVDPDGSTLEANVELGKAKATSMTPGCEMFAESNSD